MHDAAIQRHSAPTVHDEDALSTDLSTSVVFPWEALKDGAAAFAQAARDLDDEGRERVAHEIMLTANRVHAAEGGDAGDPEAVRGTARQVIDTVGVALSYRAQGDPARLGPLLATTPGVTLFRVGPAQRPLPVDGSHRLVFGFMAAFQ